MSRFSNGLKIGTILGALAGILLSPKSGKENLKWIKENANQENLNKTIKKGKNLLTRKKQQKLAPADKPNQEIKKTTIVKKTAADKKTKEVKKTTLRKSPKK